MSVPISHGSLQLPEVIAFGNPLLDIIVRINGNDLVNILDKYNLDIDGQKELPADVIQQLLQDIPPGIEQALCPGGCAQNTLRILQWLCGGPNEAHVGCIYGGLGKDLRGSILEKLIRAAGVYPCYSIHSTLPTGFSVSLVSEKCRSLVANLGAAEVYNIENLNHKYFLTYSVRIIYFEGFFITHSFDVAKEIVRAVQGKDVVIAFNLSGVYIFAEHYRSIIEMVGMSKIIFGNADEMATLTRYLNIEYDHVSNIPFLLNSLNRITISVSNSESKNWLSNDGIFVMTQGDKGPAIVVWGQGNSAQVQPVIPKAKILDTTGAGDALVAGFFAGILSRKDPKTCLEWGCKMASLIITKLGVTVPNGIQPDFLH